MDIQRKHIAAEVFMDTLVSIEVPSATATEKYGDSVQKAFGWFEYVERSCSRFDPSSELSAVSRAGGLPVRVSPLLYSLLDFALRVARLSNGAFDPAVGRQMESKGFNRNFRTGQRSGGGCTCPGVGTWKDVDLDPKERTVRLRRPLVLDLGAIAKGFAIDLAAAELMFFPSYAIDAGGDILVKGRNEDNGQWRIGIRHPCKPSGLMDVLGVSDVAVCTSGDYERRSPDGHHLMDPKSGASVEGVASVTVLAPSAMVADALSTAAFVLGPVRGLRLIEKQGAEGMIVTSNLDVHETAGYARFRL